MKHKGTTYLEEGCLNFHRQDVERLSQGSRSKKKKQKEENAGGWMSVSENLQRGKKISGSGKSLEIKKKTYFLGFQEQKQ